MAMAVPDKDALWPAMMLYKELMPKLGSGVQSVSRRAHSPHVLADCAASRPRVILQLRDQMPVVLTPGE